MSPPTLLPWHTLYANPLAPSWVAEPPAAWRRAIPEKLVRCVWFDARWRPATLRTVDGRPVIVHAPGRWNVQAGPDFQQAIVEFGDGVRQRGDVEIHCQASGWTAHRHHLDPRYNQVILHVVLWDEPHMPAAQRADGYVLPQVALQSWLPRPLRDYQVEIVLEDYPYNAGQTPGRCYEALQRLTLPEAADVLNRAGDARLQQRVWRWAEHEPEGGLMQTLYAAMLRALGSTGHRQHFQSLARLAPWHAVQHCLADYAPVERGQAAEALLLSLAGMLPASIPTTADAETAHYLATLQAYWQRVPAALRQHAWHGMDWRQPHVRPANTPERRLAAMAQILAHYPDMRLLDTAVALCRTHTRVDDPRLMRRLSHALAHLLDVPTQSYWTRRAYLGGHVGPRQRLIGLQRALTVVVDAMLPVLTLYGQQHTDAALSAQVLAGYHTTPLLPDNHVLRAMRQRLLGNDPAFLALVTGARQQQGLLQWWADFCGNDEGDCQGCNFPPSDT